MGRIPNQPILVWLGVKNQFDFAFEVINMHLLLLVAHIACFIPKPLNQSSSAPLVAASLRSHLTVHRGHRDNLETLTRCEGRGDVLTP